MLKFFGTDGIRGVANSDLTPDFVLKLGKAAGYILSKNKKLTILIGKDTRISSDMIESAFSSGLSSVGCDILKIGIIPTPAIPYLVINKKFSAGVMISASHNPAIDNGIKIFNYNGTKIDEDVECEIEKYIDENIPLVKYKNIGKIKESSYLEKDYIDYLKNSIKTSLKNIKIAIDCANGSASSIAQKLFESLCNKVVFLSCKPNGLNINKNCGALHPEVIKKSVIKNSADIGLCLDGDADRAILVDEKGNVITGDHILAILALHYRKKNILKNNTVVATVMSNIGLEILLKEKNINLIRCPVGDKYVVEKLKESGAVIGGEQAGHIIFIEKNPCSDGIFTALQIMQIMEFENKKLSELSSVLKTFPQVIVNAKVKDKNIWKENKKINLFIQEIENKIKNKGQILVRASGTENLIRIMIEGEDEYKIKKYAEELKALIEKELN